MLWISTWYKMLFSIIFFLLYFWRVAFQTELTPWAHRFFFPSLFFCLFLTFVRVAFRQMRLSATVAAFYFFVFTFLSRRLPDKMRLSAKTSTFFLLFLFTFVRIALQTDCLCTKAHVFFFFDICSRRLALLQTDAHERQGCCCQRRRLPDV